MCIRRNPKCAFRDPGLARGLVVSGLRHALAGAGHRSSSTNTGAMLGAFQPAAARTYQMDRPSGGGARDRLSVAGATGHGRKRGVLGRRRDHGRAQRYRARHTGPPPPSLAPLGAARAQLHENYIIAQTESGIVIVDQHAAHERLVYEKLKRLRAKNGVPSQALLIPEIVELSATEAATLLEIAPQLAVLGLVVEAFGGAAVILRETPALLGAIDGRALIRDILDELADQGGFDRAGGTD